MKQYVGKYGHEDNCVPSTLELDATTDIKAIDEIRAFVVSGYRDGTWATVELSGNRVYTCRNDAGRAVGKYV